MNNQHPEQHDRIDPNEFPVKPKSRTWLVIVSFIAGIPIGFYAGWLVLLIVIGPLGGSRAVANYGVIGLMVVALIVLARRLNARQPPDRVIASLMFGISLGLAFDVFAYFSSSMGYHIM